MASKKIRLPKPCNLPNLIQPKNQEKFRKEIEKAKKDRKIFKLSRRFIEGGEKYLYVVKGEDIIITEKENEKNEYKMKHHKIAEGENILMGGELVIKDTRFDKDENFVNKDNPVYYIFDNNSGHYSPDIDCDRYLIELLEKKYNMKLVSSKTKQLKRKTRRTNTFIKKVPKIKKIKNLEGKIVKVS